MKVKINQSHFDEKREKNEFRWFIMNNDHDFHNFEFTSP